jgi:O-antigen/teichoic acid export membrane protein
MGVIQRQSLKHTIVNLAGLGIGGLSTLFVYPNALEGHGLFQLLISIGIVGLPILSFGANTLVIRFFPHFYDVEMGHRGFLGLLLLQCVVGCSLCGVFVLCLWPWLGPYLHDHKPVLAQYLWAAGPLAMLFVTSTVLSLYSSNFKRIVVPSLLIDFSFKLIVPSLLIGVWQRWWTLDQAVIGLLIHASLVFVGMILYLRSIGRWQLQWPDWKWITPDLRSQMVRFVGFGTFGGFALQLASKADIFVVGAIRPLADISVYALSAFFASTLDVPTKSLYSASLSTVAQHLHDDDRSALDALYKKVSINLLCAGVLMFGAIWVSIDSLYELMDNSAVVSAGKWVFFFIGFSKLVEMGTGLNNYLIYYSQYYTWSLFSLGLMAVVNLVLGTTLVPRMGIEGAAIATLVSMTCYNTFSLYLVWRKFGLQPFQRNTIIVLALGALTYALVAWWPVGQWPPLVVIMVRSGAYSLVLLMLYWRLRVSPDLNQALSRWLPRR